MSETLRSQRTLPQSDITLIKLKSPPSNGTRGESRGATQVNAYRFNKISLCDATGKGSQRHSFRYATLLWLYPCSITGAPELGYWLPFARSTRRSIRLLRFCLAFRTSAWLSGNRFEVYSSSSA